MKQLLIAIPIYNEEKNLNFVLQVLFDNIEMDCTDVLIIDDGSTDNSFAKLKRYQNIKFFKNSGNFGYGFSVQRAFDYAVEREFKYLITMDADGQHLPQFISKFLDDSEEADIISGSRYYNGSYLNMNNIIKERFDINNKITAILNKITGFNMTDSFCGMKLYKVEILKHFKTSDFNYAMPLQVIIQAWHHKLRWKEIPVPLIYNDNQRNFNNLYENAEARFQYYLKIIQNEMENLGYEKDPDIWPAS